MERSKKELPKMLLISFLQKLSLSRSTDLTKVMQQPTH